jgi:ribonuclease HI
MQLFTDGSVHPPSGIGYGAYLVADAAAGDPAVQLKRFEQTNSSQLEIETLIWALQALEPASVTIYTDSQTIVRLPGRRARFEERNYLTSKNKPMNHAELYQTFFQLTDPIDCTFVKVKGHRTSEQKTEVDRLFTLVDRAARQALRTDVRYI